MKVEKGTRNIAAIFLNLGDGRVWMVNAITRPFYPRERNPVHNVDDIQIIQMSA
jgi:hypothetical protein